MTGTTRVDKRATHRAREALRGMATVYEYWQHRVTGEVWAVKLRDGNIIGAAQIGQPMSI